ncbi:hypothetical protein [Candidatus Protochlamydia naegleriophila]|uniref:hypothetical protein n=1 Tax=Candidatus Protochlamydia naegleriophila TaxID=389348 RepID=UPI001300E964|nr:hypothetical protein [Candidatus Protochlamydia naegleriophila]
MTPFIDSQSIELDSLSRQRIVKAVKAFHLSGKQLTHQFCPLSSHFYLLPACLIFASQPKYLCQTSFFPLWKRLHPSFPDSPTPFLAISTLTRTIF